MAETAPAGDQDYTRSPDAVTIAGLVASRQLSARVATAAALARIEELDSGRFAFTTLASVQALADADSIDARLARGEVVRPLAGVPAAIEDLISTRGLRTTFGSPLYAEHVPLEDDVAVERLRQADAIVIGKTNTSEFGYGAFGHNLLFQPTRNPWNRQRTPGGSSADSAAAAASGMLPLALGSDGGGSLRIPAALTGTFGIKPSWGRVPVYPGCRDDRMPGGLGSAGAHRPYNPNGRRCRTGLVCRLRSDSEDRHSRPESEAERACHWHHETDATEPLRTSRDVQSRTSVAFATLSDQAALL